MYSIVSTECFSRNKKLTVTIFFGFLKKTLLKTVFVYIMFWFFSVFVFIMISVLSAFSWFLSFTWYILTGMCEVSE